MATPCYAPCRRPLGNPLWEQSENSLAKRAVGLDIDWPVDVPMPSVNSAWARETGEWSGANRNPTITEPSGRMISCDFNNVKLCNMCPHPIQLQNFDSWEAVPLPIGIQIDGGVPANGSWRMQMSTIGICQRLPLAATPKLPKKCWSRRSKPRASEGREVLGLQRVLPNVAFWSG